ncbi:MAG: AMP-binding protein [Planctomycetes bacterium]|nr:AMP-binding protein [Planctomycetota bacterium]
MTEYVWKPDAETIENANITRLMRRLQFEIDPGKPDEVHRHARDFVKRTQDDPAGFWDAALRDMEFAWYTEYETTLDTTEGNAWADWFKGGETNIALNCVDRHIGSERASQVALIAETEDGGVREFTFTQLGEQVNKAANALKECGVERGDTVACYMPMVAEVVFAMLATQKLGAIFIPVFSGYAPPALRERLEDAEVKVLFTADGSMRRGKGFGLKDQADQAVDGLGCVKKVIVYKRIGEGVECNMGRRDVWWHDIVDQQSAECETVPVPSLTPALMLYTSGTTGKPKGTIHTHAGCLAQMGKELLYNFDVQDGDRFWWFSDIGWMMGPWEIIGCFMHGITLVVFEGAPNYPEPDRLWRSVEKHGATHLGISPTAVRMLMRAGDEWVDKYEMPSLRVLGSTGEPWDPESYMWFHNKVGKGKLPIINISGGTDIVGCFLAPLPIMPLKACTLQSPGLGMAIDVFNEDGHGVVDEVGYLVCKKPAPSMTRGLWKNKKKYLETYWSKFPNIWNHGDWAKVDKDGDWFLFGRADDTMKIAGRRVGPGEIESALIDHDAVSEAAAIGVPDDLKGTEVVCFVVLHPNHKPSEDLRAELVQTVVNALGKVDRPKAVLFAEDLPKTRSAKILRRLIQKKYLGEEDIGDLSSVANPEALEAIARAT